MTFPFDLRALRVLEYDKNDPNWGALLQDKIKQAISEVLQAPHQSVPVAFLEARPRPATTVTSHDKEMIEIQQELNLLRRQIEDQSTRPEISPDEARALISRYLEEGMPKGVIVRRLEKRGVPESWVRRTLEQQMTSRSRPAGTATTRSKSEPGLKD